MEVKGKMEWREPMSQQSTSHPTLTRCRQFIGTLPPNAQQRAERAKNLFLYLITQGRDIPHPESLEAQLNNCFETVGRLAGIK
jgi:hypothetical protein